MTSEKTTFIQQTMITTLIDEDLIHFRKGKKIWNPLDELNKVACPQMIKDEFSIYHHSLDKGRTRQKQYSYSKQ